jgi:type I restriction enzyme S subunit
MNEWKEHKTTDLLERGLLVIGDGYRAKNSELSASKVDGFPFARVGNIDKGFNFRQADYFPRNNLKKVGEKISKVGDVVFTSKGTVGRFAFVSDMSPVFVYSPQLCFWRSLDHNFILPRFLLYWMQSKEFFEQADAVKSQTDMADYVNLSDQRKMKITLPGINEQTAIASILSSLDDKIDLLHRQNATLEKMAETLFRQWFVEEAKEEWEEIKITDLFEVRDGTHDSPKQKEFGKKLITSKHLSKHSIDFSSAYYISEEDFDQINKRSKVDTDDILFSMIGTIGIIYLEQSNDINYAIKNIGLFKTAQNPKWKYYTVLWLKSELGNEFIHENRSGSTQEYISLGSLRSISFSIPSHDTVEAFNEEVAPLFQKIKSNTTQIRTLTTLRDTLLPKLMSGELRVKI